MRKLLIFAFAATSVAASAQVWVEQGDAGQLVGTAQSTNGVGSLSTITGSLPTAGDVDLFSIRVFDWTQFFAQTSTVGFDPQLWLFTSTGMGIAANDDNPGGGLQSIFPVGNGLYAGRTSPEIVLIGISGFNVDPVSAGGFIFPGGFSVVHGPTGPGGASPLSGWSGTGDEGTYSIALRGAEFAAVPEPGTMAVLGIGAVALLRRRRAAKK